VLRGFDTGRGAAIRKFGGFHLGLGFEAECARQAAKRAEMYVSCAYGHYEIDGLSFERFA
jgi:hypothetical protein